MKTIYVGIDISKQWLDYSICPDPKTECTPAVRVNNDIAGIAQMIQALSSSQQQAQLWFCMEHTGNYGLLLCSMLQSEELTYSCVPAVQIQKSMGMTRGKSDQVDARRIAEYAAVHQHKLKPSSLPTQALMQVKNLLAYRSQLTKTKTQFMNSLKSYQAANQVADLSFIIQNLQAKIAEIEQDIAHLETQIQQQINSNTELSNNFKLISSVKGVGLVIAAFMLVYTQNFQSFDDPRKFNCYTGLAPFEYSSGLNKGHTRTSHYRNKQLKTLLYNGAHVAAMHDPQIKKYYQRKKQEGKAHLSVINAVACKLVYRMFATVKKQEKYVVLDF